MYFFEKEKLQYCCDVLNLQIDSLCVTRTFDTSKGEITVSIFQVGYTAKYYICVCSNEIRLNEITAMLNKNENHHQAKIHQLVRILGKEIVTQLINQGLFWKDDKKKRNTPEAIAQFISSSGTNSTYQIHRLIALLEYPEVIFHNVQVHHYDLNGFNNKGFNLLPIVEKNHERIHKDTITDIWLSDLQQKQQSKKYKAMFEELLKPIREVRQELKKNSERKSKLTKAKIKKIMLLHFQGLKIREIEKKIKTVKKSTIANVIKQYKNQQFLFSLERNTDKEYRQKIMLLFGQEKFSEEEIKKCNKIYEIFNKPQDSNIIEFTQYDYQRHNDLMQIILSSRKRLKV